MNTFMARLKGLFLSFQKIVKLDRRNSIYGVPEPLIQLGEGWDFHNFSCDNRSNDFSEGLEDTCQMKK